MNYKCQNRTCRDPIPEPGHCDVCRTAMQETLARAAEAEYESKLCNALDKDLEDLFWIRDEE